MKKILKYFFLKKKKEKKILKQENIKSCLRKKKIKNNKKIIKIIKRKKKNLIYHIYIFQILKSLIIIIKNIFKKSVTLEYPKQKPKIPKNYRGVPTLVRDKKTNRKKCVACQLCEFVCPSKAIKIIPKEISFCSKFYYVEKEPKTFEIDMLRCIYCGFCQEVCPEKAIFLKNIYSLSGYSRKELILKKKELYKLGGYEKSKIQKWNKTKIKMKLD
jgi:NADH-quinone oxidoreductase subunit I